MSLPPAPARARAGVLLLAAVVSLGAWTAPAAQGAEPAPAPTQAREQPAAPVEAEPTAAPVPVSSPVAAVVQPEGPRWQVMGARASAALRSLGVDAAALGYRVEFEPGQSGLRGVTYPAQRRVVVHVRDSDTDADVLRVLAHEVGHAVSETCLDAGERAAWVRERGLAAGWYPSTLSGFSGTEDHAEVFALATLGSLPDFRGHSASAPDVAALASLRAHGLLAC